MTLILASTSRYRRELLDRLGLTFSVQASGVCEAAKPGELPVALVRRLATEKAQVVSAKAPGAVVIGSDQLACLDERILGKPGTVANAQQQLLACSGREIEFLTAVTVCRGSPRHSATLLDRTRVRFRELSEREVRNYVQREQPLDCAGAFKAEGLGIALFAAIVSDDPTALIGLPLIKVCSLLAECGIAPLDDKACNDRPTENSPLP